MNIKISSLHEVIARWSFLILFPGFFFYHSAVGLNLLPPILGGFFSPMSVLLLPLLVLGYLRTITKSKLEFTGVDQRFFLYAIYFALVVAVAFVGQAPRDLIGQHAAAIVHLLCCFFIFKMADFGNPSFRRWGFFCLAAMTVLVFRLSIDGTFYLRQDVAEGSDGIASYQGFARSYMVTSIVLLAFTDKIRSRAIIYAISIPSLYLAVARSEFAAFIVFASLFEVSSSKRPMIVIVLIALVGGVAYASLELISTLLPENRVLELLMSSESTSGEARDEYSAAAIQTILNNVFLGDYGSYISTTGVGSEAHNILSAWVDLGIIGFLLLCWVMLQTLMKFVRLSLRRSARAMSAFKLALCLIAVTIFLLCTAKDFSYMLVGAALGICAAFTAFQRKAARLQRRAQAAHGEQQPAVQLTT